MTRPAAWASRVSGRMPNRQDDHVGGDAIASVGHDHEAIAGLLDRAEPLAQPQLHPLGTQVRRERGRHLGVERWHHLRQLLDDRDRKTAMEQVLGHLQADEAAADDHGVAAGPLGEPRPDAARVGDGAQDEHAWEVDARPLRPDR